MPKGIAHVSNKNGNGIKVVDINLYKSLPGREVYIKEVTKSGNYSPKDSGNQKRYILSPWR